MSLSNRRRNEMLKPFFYIDAWQLFSNLLWILGGAILLASLSIHDIIARNKRIKRIDILKMDSFKKYAGLGLSMLFLGLILSTLIVHSNPPVKEVIYIDEEIYDPSKIERRPIEAILPFSNIEFTTQGACQVTEENIRICENGYIETPFLDFQLGSYEFEFKASGSEAYDEFAKIWIACLILQENRLFLKETVREITLSAQEKTYLHDLYFENDQIGKIRIHFYNDIDMKKGGDRDVWISNIEIRQKSLTDVSKRPAP
jgi:hypothetical protein